MALNRTKFTLSNGVYISSATGLHVSQSGTNWVAYRTDGTIEVYNASGQLTQIISPAGLVTTLAYGTSGLLSQVADPFGHILQFTYDSTNRLSTVTEPDGSSQIIYAYDANNNLVSATYPNSTKRQYQYENATFPTYLTAIVDESGTTFDSIQYDATSGAVISSQQAGGALAVSIAYPTATSAVATDSLGGTTTYQFTANSYGAPRATSVQHNSLTQSYVVPAITTDPQQRVTQFTDAKGNVTTYVFSSVQGHFRLLRASYRESYC
jgi:YD repeat-containing protein